MIIEISFLNVGYTLQFGHKAGLSEQTWLVSLIKEWYGKDDDGRTVVTYASVIFSINGKK